MVSFPYVLTASKTAKLFDELRDRGIPPKLTKTWLEAAGFKSSNDRRFVGVLRFLDIIDDKGVPNADNYKRLRQPNWREELADMIKAAYKPIFDALPNAHERPREQLIDQFRATDSSASLNVAGIMVSTFQQLCQVAHFGGAGQVAQELAAIGATTAPEPTSTSPPEASPTSWLPTSAQPLTVNINISLEIPATENSEVYDHLFKSMAEHLRDLMVGGSN